MIVGKQFNAPWRPFGLDPVTGWCGLGVFHLFHLPELAPVIHVKFLFLTITCNGGDINQKAHYKNILN